MIKNINFTEKDNNILEDVYKKWLSKYSLDSVIKVMFENNINNNAIYDNDIIIGLIRYEYKNNNINIIDTYFTEDKYLLNVVQCLFDIISQKKINQVDIQNGVDKRITDIIDKYGVQSGDNYTIKIGDFIDKLPKE